MTITDKMLQKAIQGDLINLEENLLSLPQEEASVYHHFGPGIYIREVHIKAGTFAIGHRQKKEHVNILLKGKVAMINGDDVNIVSAPLLYIGKPGRKCGYIIEDMVWQNIYATEERNIDKLEETFLDKSEEYKIYEKDYSIIMMEAYNEDREDYRKLISDLGMTEEEVRAQVENEEDIIEMPYGFSKLSVRDSYIEGKGVFLNAPVEAGEIIAVARINGKRTPVGRYTNHAKNPNAMFIDYGGDIYLVADKKINGCHGGNKGEEVTVNYRKAIEVSRCQQ